MIAVITSALLSVNIQDRSAPLTIRVKQKVEVIRGERCVDRGKLCLDDTDSKPFTIEKGETFEMIEELGEGSCRIRFKKHDAEISDCWWAEGFRDKRPDIYEVIPKKSPRKSKQLLTITSDPKQSPRSIGPRRLIAGLVQP